MKVWASRSCCDFALLYYDNFLHVTAMFRDYQDDDPNDPGATRKGDIIVWAKPAHKDSAHGATGGIVIVRVI